VSGSAAAAAAREHTNLFRRGTGTPRDCDYLVGLNCRQRQGFISSSTGGFISAGAVQH
jgi:hypothetical protein